MRKTYIVVKRNGKSIDYHRIVAEQKIGRALKKGEIVHHINGDTKDNRPENLEITTTKKHLQLHNHKERIIISCTNCNGDIKILESIYLWRKKHGQKDFYCSRKCIIRNGGCGKRYKSEIDIILKKGIKEGKTSYQISKENPELNRMTLYNHCKKLSLKPLSMHTRRFKDGLFWCNKCKTYHLKNNFSKNISQKYGISSYCKDCRRKFKC